MAESHYMLDNEWQHARKRLAILERLYDPATIGYLEEIGVAEGWQCLDIGAGGGSITVWLSQRVGTTGRVVATDINTRFLVTIDSPNVTVLEHNVVTDDLTAEAYDLVHARLVLFHVAEPGTILRKMADAVKPGGWILVEEPDATMIGADPLLDASTQNLCDKGIAAIRAEQTAQSGSDFCFGARLFGSLQTLGFEALQAMGRVDTRRGGTPQAAFNRFTYEQFKQAIVASGRMGAREYGRFLNLFDDPTFSFRDFLLVSAWGRKPQASRTTQGNT